MTRLRVEVERDHLEHLIKKPLGGLTELLWNAIDADATEITAALQRNTMGGIDGLIVEDNGTGITPEQAHRYFSHLGGSWKKLATTTQAGRSLHGRSGQGRWAAYGIGEVVHWISTAEQVTGNLAQIRITGRRSNLDEFDVGDPEQPTRPRGTVVEIEQLTGGAIRTLERDDVIGYLTTTFALTLEKYPIALKWQDILLDPKSVQSRRYSQEFVVDDVNGPIE